jgi:hypothetical protein
MEWIGDAENAVTYITSLEALLNPSGTASSG